MREIKFRVWDSLKREFADYDDYAICLDGAVSEIHDGKLNIVDSRMVVTVEQYTGLKDKNGREIYEGDIIKDGELEGTIVFYNSAWSVEYNKRSPIGRRVLPAIDCFDPEVIGNIHEK